MKEKTAELLASLRKELDVKIDEAALATVKVDLAPADAGAPSLAADAAPKN